MFKPEEFRLRPLEESDLDLVRMWRNAPRIKSVMYTDNEISAAEQKAWFERLIATRTTKAFIFEYLDHPAGYVNFSDLGVPHGRSTWGFYRGIEKAPKGLGMAMGFFAIERAFGELGARKLISETFAFNTPGLLYHQRLGFSQEGVFRAHVIKNGRPEDVVAFGLLLSDWRSRRDALATDLFGRKADEMKEACFR